jgi:hypothetical protein
MAKQAHSHQRTKARTTKLVYETVRDIRNEVSRLCTALEALPPTQQVAETLIEAKATLRRICQL